MSARNSTLGGTYRRYRIVAALLVLAALAACTGGTAAPGLGTATGANGTSYATYTIGGTVSGLTGSGLMLQNNSADTLSVAADGHFSFATALISGNSYDVSVAVQPANPNQTCVVTAGLGTVAMANVTNVSVVCSDKTALLDTIGGTVSGLVGTGLVLQNDGTDDLMVQNGSFTFATALAAGMPYNVTVKSPPQNPYQDCSIANGSGTTAASDVNNVAVICTTNSNPTFTIGGTVTGLAALQGTLVLQDNGRDNLTIAADGSFTFATAIPSGSTYAVTPFSLIGPQSFTCAFTDATGTVGTANVTNVAVTCASASAVLLTPITVTLSGLAGTGLVLQDNGGDNLSVTANGAATFPTKLAAGSAYDVTVLTQPTAPAQTCVPVGGQGTVASGQAVSIAVNCTTQTTVGGSVTGVVGTGLVLQFSDDVYGDVPLSIAANGSFTFPITAAPGDHYRVTISTNPSNPAQVCTVANGTGIIGATNVANVAVSCATPRYTVGGTVSGLTGAGLQLQDNGGDVLSITANGSFTFATSIASGGAYAATVLAQPIDPAQICSVADGMGTVGAANVTSVTVTCVTVPVNEWTWSSGSQDSNLAGTDGQTGVAAAGNLPGSRYGGATFVDAAGDLWLFGGAGFDSIDQSGLLGDLWKYDTVTQLWTFVGGSAVVGTGGSYGTLGVPAAANVPGARSLASSWTDAAGNFWLFGGNGFDSTDAGSYLSDVWMYNVASGLWTWVGGPKLAEQSGVYGTLGVAAAANIPGGRAGADSWKDAAGNFWLFGGFGRDGQGNLDYLNDLWMYSPSTRQWTWVTGANTIDAAAQYGQLGVAAAGNTPGAREQAATWTDADGNLWLFGGDSAANATGTSMSFNDLWMFSPSTRQWTWMGGPNTPDGNGVYGTQGSAAAGNIPAARGSGPASWVDSRGNFWLFGGAGTGTVTDGYLDDLWEYSPQTGLWTWQGGSGTQINQSGTYGTLGTASPTNQPGSRTNPLFWTVQGQLWMFGGLGYPDGTSIFGDLTDLWEYQPP